MMPELHVRFVNGNQQKRDPRTQGGQQTYDIDNNNSTQILKIRMKVIFISGRNILTFYLFYHRGQSAVGAKWL